VKYPYISIGIGGHEFHQGVDGPCPVEKIHDQDKPELFCKVPFLLRRADEDLLDLRYVAGDPVTIDGVEYVAYYAKQLVSRLSVSGRYVLKMSASEVEDCINAVKMLYGDERLAVISELGIGFIGENHGAIKYATNMLVPLAYSRGGVEFIFDVEEQTA